MHTPSLFDNTESARAQAATMDSLRRRLVRALSDLGLLQIVGEGWVSSADGLAFATLDRRRADRLTAALEDLTTTRGAAVDSAECDGQLSFAFDGDVIEVDFTPPTLTLVVGV